MAYNTIKLKGAPVVDELVAAGTITPGMLCEVTSAGTVQAHSTAVGPAQKMFAAENELGGEEISDDYASGDLTQLIIAGSGDRVYGLIKIGEDVVIGEPLVSAGNGSLQPKVLTTSDPSETAGAIVGYSRTTVTGGAALVRCVVEIA